MKIINAGYKLIEEPSITKKIEKVARVCYKSEDKIGEGTDMTMCRSLINRQHTAMLEHASIILEVGEQEYMLIETIRSMMENIIENGEQNRKCYLRYTNSTSDGDNYRYFVSGNIRAWYEFMMYANSVNGLPKRLYNIINDNVNNIFDIDVDAFDVDTFDYIYDEDDFYAKVVTDMNQLTDEERMVHETFSVLFTVDRGCCYDKDTKVLTTEGWKFFKDVTENDKYISLDEDNNLCEVKAKQIVVKHFEGKLHHWHSSQIDLMVTPNHNMWLGNADNPKKWDFIKSEDANNKRYRFNKSAKPTTVQGFNIFRIDGCDYENNFQSSFNKPLEFDANTFFELLGWWVTDGSISEGKNGSGNRIVITQIKELGRERIKELLDILDLSYSEYKSEIRINCPQLYKWLKYNFVQNEDFRKTYYIRIPRWFYSTLSCENLKAFLNGIIGGDGTPHTKGNGFQIYTASEDFAEDLVELALYIGMCANKYSVPERDRDWGEYISHCKEQYVVSFVTTNEHFFYAKNNTGKDEVEYNDNVYCVELPIYHRLYVMRNGKACWCGNTHELVRMRDCSFAQESTRYCNYANGKFSNEITVILPCFFDTGMGTNSNSLVYKEWESACKNAEASYFKLLEYGAKPQEARDVLPTSVKADIVMTTNLAEWKHIFNLRACDSTGPAHPQMKEVMIPLFKEMREKYPFAFGDMVAADEVTK